MKPSLKDLAQFQVRNQISNVQGASVPQPYGGTYRQIQIYVDPLKIEARNLSLNDVVQSVNSSNLILPAGDVRIGSKDFNIYANSQFPDAKSMNEMPLKSVGQFVRAGGRHRARRKTPARCNTTSCASTASVRSMCRSSSRAATATPSPS